MRGKNSGVIRQMRLRIEQEQAEFDASGAKLYAVRSVHLKLLKDLFTILGHTQLRARVSELAKALKQPGIKLGVKKAYAHTFERLRADFQQCVSLASEIQAMLEGSFKNLNAEYGFTLQAPDKPDLHQYINDLDVIENSHIQYLSLGNALRLAQPEFGERLARALLSRLRVVYDTATTAVELWNKSAAAQLDAQLRERRRNFTRRIEAVSRIQDAASGLDERIRELQSLQGRLHLAESRLEELTAELMTASDDRAAA